MCLPTSRLAVGETCRHTTFKNGLHQRFGCELVDQVVGGGLIKGVVKVEDLVVQVLGKIHLLFWLMNQQGPFSRYRHHVYLLSVNF